MSPSTFRANKSQQRGFTLVELLVVIAVISILAGMLLPALENARDLAVSIKCTNNIKQCGLSLNMYADDYNDLFPCVQNTWDGKNVSWSRVLSGLNYASEPSLGSPTIFVCPGYTPEVWKSSNATYGMWVGNSQLGELGDYSAASRYHIRRSKVSNDRALLADSTRGEELPGYEQSVMISTGAGLYINYGSARVIHLRHAEKGNCLFVDGHSESKDSWWLSDNAMYNWKYRE